MKTSFRPTLDAFNKVVVGSVRSIRNELTALSHLASNTKELWGAFSEAQLPLHHKLVGMFTLPFVASLLEPTLPPLRLNLQEKSLLAQSVQATNLKAGTNILWASSSGHKERIVDLANGSGFYTWIKGERGNNRLTVCYLDTEDATFSGKARYYELLFTDPRNPIALTDEFLNSRNCHRKIPAK